MKAQWPPRLLGLKMKIVGSRSSGWHTVRQNDKNVFYVVLWALCLCWTAESAWTIPSWCIWAGQKQQASRLPLLAARTGTVTIISTSAPSSLVPPTYAGTELTAQNNENLGRGRRGKKGKDSRFIFSVYEIANFQLLTLENPFVKYLNKSKQQYKRGDSRFPLRLPTFFSCHLSQDRISPLDGSCLL